MDIGTTPMGFDVVDVVGSLSYSNDLGPIGYTVNAHRRPISSSVLAFAGQHVIAEGIETEAQRDWLAEAGVESGQGFLFARAVPSDVFEQRYISSAGNNAKV
jgi:FOG: EAL domain